MTNELYITSVLLKHFRCFEKQQFDLLHPITVLEGSNGAGKTSLLEAMFYSAYLRSFRAKSTRDLVQFGYNNFFISTFFQNHEVNIGFLISQEGIKRHIKIDQKTVSSHRELHDYCRIITVTEDDLLIIKGSPDHRRTFIDQAQFLIDIESLQVFKVYKEILENRMALIQKKLSFDDDQFLFWTEKLWDISHIIQEQRKQLLSIIIDRAIPLLHLFWPESVISIEYEKKGIKPEFLTFQDFLIEAIKPGSLFSKEQIFKRSFFGAHLDDIEIKINGKKSRYFSSRGQQKLLILILKIALLEHVIKVQGKTAFLLDDFTTDLDEVTVDKLMNICLNIQSQLIFASPVNNGREIKFLKEKKASFGIISLKEAH